MARFFLHLYNRAGAVPDDEGTDVPDLDAACSIAVASVRDILAEEAKKGRIDLHGRIEIAAADGQILRVLPFSEAVELRLEGDGP